MLSLTSRTGRIDSSRLNLRLHHRSQRIHHVFGRPFFSTSYELPPQDDRFATPLLSSSYELLFSQAICFDQYLRCPLFFCATLFFYRFRRSLAIPAKRRDVHEVVREGRLAKHLGVALLERVNQRMPELAKRQRKRHTQRDNVQPDAVQRRSMHSPPR